MDGEGHKVERQRGRDGGREPERDRHKGSEKRER
jgi:hypothetical protein